jgi:cyclopropane-fatty-acyl-phospholipid synthase
VPPSPASSSSGSSTQSPVRAVYPDGSVRGGGGPDDPAISIVRPVDVFERMAHNPKIGLGEAYMAGDWTAAPGTDLGALLTPFAERFTSLVPRPLRRLRAVVDRRIPRRLRNTLAGSRHNISAHYDLSNELFAQFLDPTLSYSSALFEGEPPFAGQDLEAAQQRKIDAILDLAGVREGTRLLEVGTGWGALAITAARRGAHVTSVTLSGEQLELARKRVAMANLEERVDLRLQDYREVRGSFDAIVSVEMIEAVGEEFWPTYFATLDQLLAPGGTIAIQAILMEHDRVLATRKSFGWIQKYIFRAA